MIYILQFLGLMCFDGIHRDYFDLRCNKPLEKAYSISSKPCATLWDPVVPESYLKNKKIKYVKHNSDDSIKGCN